MSHDRGSTKVRAKRPILETKFCTVVRIFIVTMDRAMRQRSENGSPSFRSRFRFLSITNGILFGIVVYIPLVTTDEVMSLQSKIGSPSFKSRSSKWILKANIQVFLVLRFSNYRQHTDIETSWASYIPVLLNLSFPNSRQRRNIEKSWACCSAFRAVNRRIWWSNHKTVLAIFILVQWSL